VIFDTDIGIDDAMALLFLHKAANTDLLAITTVVGNASLKDVTRNALYVKQRFNIPAPVFAGASKPIAPALGSLEGDNYPDFVHGKNGLGDIELENPEITAGAKTAAQAIIDLVTEHPGEISIITVGRLTKLAIALQQEPTIAPKIKELVIMGGVFGFNGHRGNVSPVAEANIGGDPRAADIVATAGINTTFVGLDVTEDTRFDDAFIEEIKHGGDELGEFIHAISRYYFNFYETLTGERSCPLHDSSAIAYWLKPELYQTKTAVIRVVTQGLAAGQTIAGHIDGDSTGYVINDWEQIGSQPIKPCRFCVSVNAQAVLDLYKQTLLG
jgi:inosine-uridine nucleoside N-ribohydrolase